MSEARAKVGMVYSGKVGGSWLPVKIEKSLGHGRYDAVTMPGGAKVKLNTAAIKGDGQSVEDWTAAHTPREHDLPVPTPAPKVEKTKKEKKPNGLDAVARVLKESGTPMNSGDMVKTALEKGYWSTGGKTPAATIYAAIIREISLKGDKSRFRKTERGMFELTDAGKQTS